MTIFNLHQDQKVMVSTVWRKRVCVTQRTGSLSAKNRECDEAVQSGQLDFPSKPIYHQRIKSQNNHHH